MSIPKSTQVSKPEHGRRLAVSDVHGCFKTLKKLLKKVDLQKEDQLFILGDFVNRGPKSHRVLDLLIQLKSEGFQVYVLRGNHEQMVLNSSKKRTGQRKRQLKNLNSLSLLEKGKLISRYREFLQKTYHYIDTGDYYLVHAGFNSKSKSPLQDDYAMLNIRKFSIDHKLFHQKSVIIGHTPKSLSFIKESTKGRKIFIDNGCVNIHTKGQGKLLCLDLDTRKITKQKNKDF